MKFDKPINLFSSVLAIILLVASGISMLAIAVVFFVAKREKISPEVFQA